MALIPIPGAMATGNLAYSPIIRDPIIDMTTVAVKAASLSIPASAIMAELTTMMYDIARKTRIPPFTSVLNVEPLDVIPKNPSSLLAKSMCVVSEFVFKMRTRPSIDAEPSGHRISIWRLARQIDRWRSQSAHASYDFHIVRFSIQESRCLRKPWGPRRAT